MIRAHDYALRFKEEILVESWWLAYEAIQVFGQAVPLPSPLSFSSDAETVKFSCDATNEKKEALAILLKFLFFSFSLLNNINQGTKLCNSYVSTSVSTRRYAV